MGCACSHTKAKGVRPDESHPIGANVSTVKSANWGIDAASDAPFGTNSSPHILAKAESSLRSLGDDDPFLTNSESLPNHVENTPFPSHERPLGRERRVDNLYPASDSAIGAVFSASRHEGGCPSPSERGPGSEVYFPAGHDAGMRLGAAKYTNVGVLLSPDDESPALRSLNTLNTSGNKWGSEGRKATPPPPMHAGRIIFTDDDTAGDLTASSAFATPRELNGVPGGVPGSPGKASIVSHGSMVSVQPHGYSYYNSNAIDDGYPLMQSSAMRPPSVTTASVISTAASPDHRQIRSTPHRPQPSLRNTSTTTMITDVRTNVKKSMTASIGGASSPLTRLSSIAGSDNFHSCRSLTDTSLSTTGFLPAATPPGIIAQANAHPFSSSYAESTLNVAPPTEGQLYTCRSVYTTATDLLTSYSSSRPIVTDLQRRVTAAPTRSEASVATGRSTSHLGGWKGEPLPSQRHAGIATSAAGGPESHLFFSALSNGGDIPVERFPPTESIPGDRTGLEDPISHVGATAANMSRRHVAHTTTAAAIMRSGSGSEKSSVKGATHSVSSSAGHPLHAAGGADSTWASMSYVDSLNSASAFASRMGTPLNAKRMPREWQTQGTSTVIGGQSTTHGTTTTVADGRGKEIPLRRPHYTQRGSSGDTNSLVHARSAMRGAMAAAAVPASKLHPASAPMSSSRTIAAPATIPAPIVAPKVTDTSTGVQSSVIPSVSSSSQSDANRRRRSPASDGPAAEQDGRTTQAYVEASLHPLGCAGSAIHDRDVTGSPSLHSESPSVSRGVLSDGHGQAVPAVSQHLSKPVRKPQLPRSSTTHSGRRFFSNRTEGRYPQTQPQSSSSFRGAPANGKKAYTPSTARAVPGTSTTGAAAAPADTKSDGHVMISVRTSTRGSNATSCSLPGTHRHSKSKDNGSDIRSSSTMGRRRVGALLASANTLAEAAVARRLSGGAAGSGLGGEVKQRAPASRNVSRPWATNMRKPPPKRTAAAASSAISMPRGLQRGAPAAPLKRSSRPAEAAEMISSTRDESIVEDTLSIDHSGGEAAVAAAEKGAVDADCLGGDRGLETAPVQVPPQSRLLEGCGNPMEDVSRVDNLNGDFPAQRGSLQTSRSDVEGTYVRVGDLRASPDVSDALAITPAEEAAFPVSCTEAQPVSQINGATSSAPYGGSDSECLEISGKDSEGGDVVGDYKSAEGGRAAIFMEVGEGCIAR